MASALLWMADLQAWKDGNHVILNDNQYVKPQVEGKGGVPWQQVTDVRFPEIKPPDS